jgi:hypothetical protein
MSRFGGNRQGRCGKILLAAVLLVAGVTGCEYSTGGDAAPPPGPRLVTTQAPRVPHPTENPEQEALEAGNRAKLERLLGAAAPATAVLADSGLVGGPGIGFSRNAQVKTAGSYTVTAACVGAPDAQLTLSQDVQAGDALDLSIDCAAVSTRVIRLHRGPLLARLARLPSGSVSGAVAGVRVTPRTP